MKPSGSTSVFVVFIIGFASITHAATSPGVYHEPLSTENIWTPAGQTEITKASSSTRIQPDAFCAFVLSPGHLEAKLATAPLEESASALRYAPEIVLPMPDGSGARFTFVESPIMEPELAAKFPEIRTYLGWGIDDPNASVRFDKTPMGFHAQILSPSGTVYIDPYGQDKAGIYASYYKRDYRGMPQDQACRLFKIPEEFRDKTAGDSGLRTGETLRTYRLACAATGEYVAYHGGTVSAGMSAITTTVNRVVGIYETELAIRMVLVAGNDQLVYTSAATDPYTNNDGVTMLSENQSTVDSVIGDANYDIGHVFSTGGGGVAYRGSVCVSGWKAGGVTGRGAPIGDAFDVDYVAHEMGHQFGGNHTFNGSDGSCSGSNRNGPTAYEPGSGSTIMAYAGICGVDDLQLHSDPYFHSESYREIRTYVTSGSGCETTSATGNNDPTVDAGDNYTIPQSTPFTLTATGSDPDGDTPTFCWEERDLGPQAALSASDDGSIPLFRTWLPTISPNRTFPRLAELLNNTTPLGEQLPTTSRTMNFRVTARDNRAGGGGVDYSDMQVTVDSGSGPFRVTSPNNGTEVWSGSALVTWDVAGTDSPPVNATHVDILLSTDGGNTFPITVLSNTPNDGSETVIVPGPQSNSARIKIVGRGNIFFDISDNDFTVDEAGSLAIVLPDGTPETIPPSVPTTFNTEILEFGENLVPGSVTLHYSYTGGSYLTAPLTPLGGNLFEATLPAPVCTDTPRYYLSAQGDGGTTVYSPSNAPVGYYESLVGELSVIFEDDFETNKGWTVTDSSSLSAGTWERGIPENNDRGDPPADQDGSGQCYLTDNDPSTTNSDVDNGTTTLTSPVMDMSYGGTVSYAYWLNDDPLGYLGVEDSMEVEVAINAAGDNWQNIRTYTTASAGWRTDSIEVGTEVSATATFRIRFSVSDLTPGDVVEGGLDAVAVTSFTCEETANCFDGILNQSEERIDCGGPNCDPCECTSDVACDDSQYCTGIETCDVYGYCQSGTNPCQVSQWCYETGSTCINYGEGDFEPDGDVDLLDFAAFQRCFGSIGTSPCENANLNGSGMIDINDYTEFESVLVGPN